MFSTYSLMQKIEQTTVFIILIIYAFYVWHKNEFHWTLQKKMTRYNNDILKL